LEIRIKAFKGHLQRLRKSKYEGMNWVRWQGRQRSWNTEEISRISTGSTSILLMHTWQKGTSPEIHKSPKRKSCKTLSMTLSI
jgi:hypothetical protein